MFEHLDPVFQEFFLTCSNPEMTITSWGEEGIIIFTNSANSLLVVKLSSGKLKEQTEVREEKSSLIYVISDHINVMCHFMAPWNMNQAKSFIVLKVPYSSWRRRRRRRRRKREGGGGGNRKERKRKNEEEEEVGEGEEGERQYSDGHSCLCFWVDFPTRFSSCWLLSFCKVFYWNVNDRTHGMF